jgi:hypothetical protein
VSPFIPLAEQARWRTIYELLRQTPIDGVLTYAVMGEALDLDPDDDRHTLQVAMRRAAREFEQIDLHAVTPLINVGYRVVRPPEHYDLARRHQRRSSRELAKGHSKVVNVDVTALDPLTRHAFEVVGQALVYQMAFNKRLDIRQRSLENTVREVATQQQRTASWTAEQFAEFNARLQRLEGDTD